MLRKSNLSLLGVLFAGLLPAQQAQAALIMPTGGGLNVSIQGISIEGNNITGSTSVGISPSNFDFLHGIPGSRVNAVTESGGLRAELSAEHILASGLDRLSVSGSATGIGNGTQASGSGQLGFDLTAATPLRFLFSSNPANLFLGNSEVMLFKDAPTGSQLLNCTGATLQGDACSFGTGFPQGSPQGLLTLDAGHYELLFNVSTVAAGGTSLPSSFAFSLTPVPVPAGIWLLGSVLTGLLSFLRRKTA